MDGMRKQDPPTMKKLPVEADVPEFLAEAGRSKNATEKERAIGDWGLVAYYYLLRIGEYTRKASRNEDKQTKQFKLSDATFFEQEKDGSL